MEWQADSLNTLLDYIMEHILMFSSVFFMFRAEFSNMQPVGHV